MVWNKRSQVVVLPAALVGLLLTVLPDVTHGHGNNPKPDTSTGTGDGRPPRRFWVDTIINPPAGTESAYRLPGPGALDLLSALSLATFAEQFQSAGNPPAHSPVLELLAARGPHHDLNGDGIVGVNDLLIVTTQVPISVEDFLATLQHWGQEVIYDLNYDGTVDSLDLVALLSQRSAIDVAAELDALAAELGQGLQHDSNCDGTVDAADLLAAISQPSFNVQDVLGVFQEWGQVVEFDLNCDGAVDARDQLQLLIEIAATIQ